MIRPSGIDPRLLLSGFELGWLSLLGDGLLAVSALAYLLGALRLRQRGRRWRAGATASFMGGIAVVFVAVGSGLAHYDDVNFSAHVVQHILLMMVAPPLLVLGRPLTLLLQASGRAAQTMWLAIMRSRPLALATSWPSALVYYGVMWGYFFSPWYAASVRSPALHEATHLAFLLAGLCYWQCLLAPDRYGHQPSRLARVGAILAGMPIEMYLGFALHGSTVAIGPGTTAATTRAGGQLFWWLSMLVSGVALAIALGQWVLEEERAAARLDRLEQEDGGWSYPEPSELGSGQRGISRGLPARAR